jgi:hypothetical protein
MTDDTTESVTPIALLFLSLTRPRRVFVGAGLALLVAALVCMVLFCVAADGWDAYLPVIPGEALEVRPHSDAAYPYSALGLLCMALGISTMSTALTRERTLLVGCAAFGAVAAMVAMFLIVMTLAGVGA